MPARLLTEAELVDTALRLVRRHEAPEVFHARAPQDIERLLATVADLQRRLTEQTTAVANANPWRTSYTLYCAFCGLDSPHHDGDCPYRQAREANATTT